MEKLLTEKLFASIEYCSDPEQTQVLLASGADPNATKSGGILNTVWMALFASVQEGDMDRVRLLLDYGANPRQQGDHSLLLASSMGLTGIVRLLLEHGAEADRKDDEGSTALTEASWHGDIDTVKVLLDHGADINLVGGAGDFGTALMRAATNFHPPVVSLLLEHGADINSTGVDYSTVWDRMRYQSDRLQSLSPRQFERRNQILEMLAKAGATSNFNSAT